MKKFLVAGAVCSLAFFCICLPEDIDPATGKLVLPPEIEALRKSTSTDISEIQKLQDDLETKHQTDDAMLGGIKDSVAKIPDPAVKDFAQKVYTYLEARHKFEGEGHKRMKVYRKKSKKTPVVKKAPVKKASD